MTTHDLKTWPYLFAAILDGRKTYEIRKADRPFEVGDRLRLREWDPTLWEHPTHGIPAAVGYTGRELLVEVTYLTPGGAWGLPEGLCVMAIRKVEP